MKRIRRTILVALTGMVASFAFASQTVQDEMLETFQRLARINSQSSEDSVSTYGQYLMALEIERTVNEILKSDPDAGCVTVSPTNYVYVRIRPNIKKPCKVLGVSCHLDVTPEAPGGNIVPIVDMRNGHTIVRTDGSTLLGADDKCGVAIALQLIKKVVTDKKLKHGEIVFAFCPNEDVGRAAENIDTLKFNPEILFDIDGPGGENVTKSNFTARGFNLKFIGRDAHPGDAKAEKLGDAVAAAATFVSFFPIEVRPERTEGLEGYIHPWGFKVDSLDVTVLTRVRYFDPAEGKRFDGLLKDAVSKVKSDYPNVCVEVLYDDLQYENVALSLHPQARQLVEKAAAITGKEVKFADERGGTTAAMFAAKGMISGMCLFSGQHEIHSTREYADLQEMEDSYKLMLEIIKEVPKLPAAD